MRLLPLLALLLVGCGPSSDAKPTPDEVAGFKGKEITPEQRAKGMAAAMGGANKPAAPAAAGG